MLDSRMKYTVKSLDGGKQRVSGCIVFKCKRYLGNMHLKSSISWSKPIDNTPKFNTFESYSIYKLYILKLTTVFKFWISLIKISLSSKI